MPHCIGRHFFLFTLSQDVQEGTPLLGSFRSIRFTKYGGSVSTKPTLQSGISLITSTQSPCTIQSCSWTDLILVSALDIVPFVQGTESPVHFRALTAVLHFGELGLLGSR